MSLLFQMLSLIAKIQSHLKRISESTTLHLRAGLLNFSKVVKNKILLLLVHYKTILFQLPALHTYAPRGV